MMPGIGPFELVIVLVLVIIVFGAGKLPEIGSAVGKGIKEFRATTREINEIKDDLDVTKDVKEAMSVIDEPETKPASTGKPPKQA
jgi:sec-independent protein translocase protein TatA